MTPEQRQRIEDIVKGITSYIEEAPALEAIYKEIENMEWKAYTLGYIRGGEWERAHPGWSPDDDA